MSGSHANPLSSAELAAFVAAVEAASVHGAADALDLTQSAVTKRIHALERRTNVTLFQRGRFGVRPTAAGRLLYPEAKQALAALRHAEHVISKQRDVSDRTLTVAASHTVGEFLLPGWLSAFRTVRQPDMLASVEIINSPAVLQAVREREVQIGFVEGLDPLDEYEVLTVREDSLVVVVAGDHRWARRRAVSPGDLTDEPYIARNPAPEPEPWSTRHCSGQASSWCRRWRRPACRASHDRWPPAGAARRRRRPVLVLAREAASFEPERETAGLIVGSPGVVILRRAAPPGAVGESRPRG